MPILGALSILAILTGFASGALPLDNTKPVDFHKLALGQPVYTVNK